MSDTEQLIVGLVCDISAGELSGLCEARADRLVILAAEDRERREGLGERPHGDAVQAYLDEVDGKQWDRSAQCLAEAARLRFISSHLVEGAVYRINARGLRMLGIAPGAL